MTPGPSLGPVRRIRTLEPTRKASAMASESQATRIGQAE